MGASIGIAVTNPIFGFMIRTSSWENVFHLCGIVGTIWYCFWLYFVYDFPEKHPRIDPNEKEYILKALETSRSKHNLSKTRVPWKSILTSKAVWMNIICQWGSVWQALTIFSQAPSYFRLVHGLDVEMTGIITGYPHYLRAIFSYLISALCDRLLEDNKLSRTNVRKLATFISTYFVTRRNNSN